MVFSERKIFNFPMSTIFPTLVIFVAHTTRLFSFVFQQQAPSLSFYRWYYHIFL